ncbi:MAG: response regulator [Gemmatimonadota bacterium]|nr:response regulator [Gemmatimonadota bacterium]
MRPCGPTLLVVEDLEDQAALVGIAARRAHPGLEVQTASHGGEAIAYLSGQAPFADRSRHPWPDLVLLDLFMPDVDGFAVLEWIKALPRPLGIPVVVLTASVSDEDEARALALGAESVHRKPVQISELGNVVRDIVLKWIGREEIISRHIWEMG